MFCTNCGAQLPDGAKFCSSCGAQLQADAETINPAVNAAAENAFGQTSETGESAANGMDANNASPLQDYSQQAENVPPVFQGSARQAENAELPPQNAAPQAYYTGQPARRPEETISLKVLCGILGIIGLIGLISNLVSFFQMLGTFSQYEQSLRLFGLSASLGGYKAIFVLYMLISMVLSALMIFVYCMVVFRWTPERNDGFFVAITTLEVLSLLAAILFVIIFSIAMGPLFNQMGAYGAVFSGALGVGTVIGCIVGLLLIPGLYFLLSHLAGLTPLKTKGGFSAFFTELKKAPSMIIDCAKSMKK